MAILHRLVRAEQLIRHSVHKPMYQLVILSHLNNHNVAAGVRERLCHLDKIGKEQRGLLKRTKPSELRALRMKVSATITPN